MNVFMKNIMIFLVLSIILVTQTKVYSQEEIDSNKTITTELEERRKQFAYVRITPLVVPGIAVGFTNRFNISQNKVIDLTVAVNYHDLDLFTPGIFKSFGVSLITEHFSNSQATGFFSRFNLGAEYITLKKHQVGFQTQLLGVDTVCHSTKPHILDYHLR